MKKSNHFYIYYVHNISIIENDIEYIYNRGIDYK